MRQTSLSYKDLDSSNRLKHRRMHLLGDFMHLIEACKGGQFSNFLGI